MKISNVHRRLVRSWRSERGDGAIGSIISMSIFITLLFAFIWMILTYYSFRVLSTAANEGAAIGAYYDPALEGPNVQNGVTHAENLINETGTTSLVEDVVVKPKDYSLGDQTVELEVTGKSVSPFFSLNLKATGSAPVEEFRPQGDEL